MVGVPNVMEQPPPEAPRASKSLPRWIVILVGAIAVIALALVAVLQVEIMSLQSEVSTPGTTQLFGGVVNVTQELAPGNASYGYYGGASFSAPIGSGNPLLMQVTVFEAGGVPVVLEFVVCSEVSNCGIRDGNLHLVSLTPQLSESTMVLEPATGYYSLDLLNLPGYTSGVPLAPCSVQLTVTLLGHVDLH